MTLSIDRIIENRFDTTFEDKNRSWLNFGGVLAAEIKLKRNVGYMFRFYIERLYVSILCRSIRKQTTMYLCVKYLTVGDGYGRRGICK